MAGFWGCGVETEDHTADTGQRAGAGAPDEVSAEGTLCFAFSTEGKSVADAQHHYLEQVDRLGYKIGLRIRADQTVRYFAFRGDAGEVRMVESADVTQDLDSALGAGPGEKWVGFLPDSKERRRHVFPETCVICYQLTLRLTPRARLPLLIPIAIRHNNGRSFAESFIGSVVVVRAPRRSP